MFVTIWAIVHNGRIEPLEPVDLPEGSKVLVTCVPEDDSVFWLDTSQTALDRLWDNEEDDVYARLLEE